MSYLSIDQSVLSVVVICHKCGWRTTRATAPSGWTAAALHAKAAHNDTNVVAKARTAARSAKRRRVAKRNAES